MRVYDSSVAGATGQEASRVRECQNGSSSGSSPVSTNGSSPDDHVELSNTLGALARAVSSDQSSRASRIQALASQVQNGTYQPNPQAISRGMISEALTGGRSRS